MVAIPPLAENPSALDALSHVELVYTDLDGTLLGLGGSLLVGGDGRPSSAAAEAVVRLNEAELPAVITTGRNRIQSAEIARLLGWRGFIAELGCVIVPDRGAEPIYFTGEWAEDLVEPGDTPYAIIERAGALVALNRAFPGRIEPHAPYHLNREATHMLRGYLDVGAAQSVLDALEIPVAIVDNGVIHPLATALTGDLAEIHAYHLLPPGVSKAGAVGRDLVRRGLRREETAGIGDSSADVEIADVTALAVVVANATEDERVLAAAEGRDNVFATRGKRGDGWAEFARAWMSVRSKS